MVSHVQNLLVWWGFSLKYHNTRLRDFGLFSFTSTGQQWAAFIRHLLDDCYPDAEKVVLVMDNLNTHDTASFYATFSANEALALSNRLEIHHTPKHGSWLNVAEIELSALTTQCLDRRFEDINHLALEISAWEKYRNRRPKPINWQFRTAEARVKLKKLYPQI